MKWRVCWVALTTVSPLDGCDAIIGPDFFQPDKTAYKNDLPPDENNPLFNHRQSAGHAKFTTWWWKEERLLDFFFLKRKQKREKIILDNYVESPKNWNWRVVEKNMMGWKGPQQSAVLLKGNISPSYLFQSGQTLDGQQVGDDVILIMVPLRLRNGWSRCVRKVSLIMSLSGTMKLKWFRLIKDSRRINIFHSKKFLTAFLEPFCK